MSSIKVPDGRRTGGIAFGAWSICAAILVFALLSAASIGLYILPFAVIAGWWVTRHAQMWPEGLGSLAGAGSVLLLVAFSNRNSVPCPPSGSYTSVVPGSCGGRDPTSWLLIGAALVCVSMIGYALARSRRPHVR